MLLLFFIRDDKNRISQKIKNDCQEWYVSDGHKELRQIYLFEIPDSEYEVAEIV